MPSRAFFDHVRGLSDDIPPGYAPAGMRVYRHLVHLGVSQVLEARFPEVRQALGDAPWHALITAFVRQSHWTSHDLGDLPHAFTDFLARSSV